MSDIAASPYPSTLDAGRFYRAAAACLPALVIAYSALIDPLVNLNVAEGITHARIAHAGGGQKSTFLAKILIPGFFLIAILLAYRMNPVIQRHLKQLAIPGGLFLSFTLISFLWSRAPSETFNFAVYQIMLWTTLFLAVAVSGEPGRILKGTLVLFAIVVAVNLAAVAVRPESTEGHAGIYNFKNTLGGAAGCAFLFGLFHLFHGKLFWRAVALWTMAGALILTFASSARTAMALIFLAPVLATMLWGTSRLLSLRPLITAGLLGFLGVSGFLTLSLMAGIGVKDILIAFYNDTTFTGRIDIWLFMYDYIQQSPWYGNGYRGFWSLGDASPKLKSEDTFIRTIGGGHNGYMDILLDLGIIGLSLLLLYMLTSLSIITKFGLRPAHKTLCYLSMFIFLASRNMMESGLLWLPTFDSLCFVLVGLLACCREPQNSPSPLRNGQGHQNEACRQIRETGAPTPPNSKLAPGTHHHDHGY